MVSDEPGRNVCPRSEEEALPEGDLSGVSDNNLEAEDSDGVGDRFIQPDQGEVVVIGSDRNRPYINICERNQKEGDSEKSPFRYLVVAFRCEPAAIEFL